jgi:hypothetical protein
MAIHLKIPKNEGKIIPCYINNLSAILINHLGGIYKSYLIIWFCKSLYILCNVRNENKTNVDFQYYVNSVMAL